MLTIPASSLASDKAILNCLKSLYTAPKAFPLFVILNKFCAVLPVVFQFLTALVTSGAKNLPKASPPPLYNCLALSALLRVLAAASEALIYLLASNRLPTVLTPLTKLLPVPATKAAKPAGAPAPVDAKAADPIANTNSSTAIEAIIPAV